MAALSAWKISSANHASKFHSKNIKKDEMSHETNQISCLGLFQITENTFLILGIFRVGMCYIVSAGRYMKPQKRSISTKIQQNTKSENRMDFCHVFTIFRYCFVESTADLSVMSRSVFSRK